MKDLHEEFRTIWLANGLPESFLANISFTGDPDEAVYSSFRLGAAALIAIGLSGLSAAYLHFLRTGVVQRVTVDARHAVLSFHSEAYYTIDNALPTGDKWDSIAGLYKTRDNGWVRIHTNFPHHRAGVLSVLSVPDTPSSPATKEAVGAAIAQWDAQDLEDACAETGMCVFRLRTLEQWEQSPQGRALASVPVVDVRPVGVGIGAEETVHAENMDIDAVHVSRPAATHSSTQNAPASRPLTGLRVLDLSRVLAGPIAGRTLAAHGAQVLLITSPSLPDLPLLDTETSLGKRTTQIDLNFKGTRLGGKEVGGRERDEEETDGKETLRALARDADVFLQAYRPGALQAKGFGVQDVLRMKREAHARVKEDGDGVFSGGIVYASLLAWGWEGPWAGRRGFDSLVQTATGFNYDEGAVFMYHEYSKSASGPAAIVPRPLPMQALDHAAGYFLAFGVNVGLIRRLETGGSYEVRVSLAGVGKWVRSLGRVRLDWFVPSPSGEYNLPALPKNAEDEEIRRLSVEWRERRGASGSASPSVSNHGEREGEKEMMKRRRMTALRHAAVLEKTPVREGFIGVMEDEGDWGAPMRLDADGPVWTS